jgi:hypothetical protein
MKKIAALPLSDGDFAKVVMNELALIEALKLAEATVNAHDALVVQFEKETDASFERGLTRKEGNFGCRRWGRSTAEREEEKNALIKGMAAV